MFPLLTHPLAMGLNLLFSTFLIAVIVGVNSLNFWISYTLLLILSGGLLVIFVYVSLLASNERFKTKWSWGLFILFGVVFFMSSGFKIDRGVSEYNRVSLPYWLKSLYDRDLYRLTLFIVIYLLVTLLVVVYNTKKDSYPLRSIK